MSASSLENDVARRSRSLSAGARDRPRLAEVERESPTFRPGTRLGAYVLETELGRGASGSVHRGRHAILERRVAIKVLTERAAADPGQRARLRVEGLAVHRVGHPAVVDVFDIGPLDAPRPYLVMELLEGRTLHALFRSGEPVAPGLAASLLAPIGAALDQAHRRGVVHRDIKPENIIVEDRGGARLIDFGVALVPSCTPPAAEGTHLVGTPRYMAPEIADGAAGAPASDLYGLGVCLYELIVGRAPFVGPSSLDVLWQHVTRAPRPPSSARPELSSRVDEVVLALLEKDPSHRPATASEALESLARAGRGETPRGAA